MKTALKYAFIYVVAAFVWSCGEYFTGLQSTRVALHPYFVTPYYFLLTGVIYYLAVREKELWMVGRSVLEKSLSLA